MHQAAPPPVQNVTRVGLGVFCLVACGYVACYAPEFFGRDFGELLALTVHAPSQAPAGLWVWLGFMTLGLIWSVVGLQGPHSPGSTMEAIWRAAQVVLGLCALYFHWYLPREWEGWIVAKLNLILRGFYFAFIAESAVHFLLAVKRPAGDARNNVQKHIDNSAVVFKPARRR